MCWGDADWRQGEVESCGGEGVGGVWRFPRFTAAAFRFVFAFAGFGLFLTGLVLALLLGRRILALVLALALWEFGCCVCRRIRVVFHCVNCHCVLSSSLALDNAMGDMDVDVFFFFRDRK